MKIIIKKSEMSLLAECIKRGASGSVLRTKPFKLEQVVSTFTTQISNSKAKSINKKKQLSHYEEFFKHPLKQPTVFVISSKINAMQAKLLATVLMMQALKEGINSDSTSLPKWHILTGGYKDVIRDKGKLNISMLILSNVDDDSSAIKKEKLVDLLEIYSTIPRLVVATGSDPLEFMSRIRYQTNKCIYIA